MLNYITKVVNEYIKKAKYLKQILVEIPKELQRVKKRRLHSYRRLPISKVTMKPVQVTVRQPLHTK
jgi:hypothetical protein